MYRGGVSIASNDSDAVALERVSLKYVAKRRFITQITEISTCKGTDFFTNSQDVTAKYDFRLTI